MFALEKKLVRQISSSIVITIFATVILAALFFFHIHGFPTQDESWVIQASVRLFDGQKVYRDFQYMYHPGSLYVNAVSFWLFGTSVFASRSIAGLNSILSILLLALTFRKLRLSTFHTLLGIFLFLLWGPGHLNFVWPVMFCLTTAIATGTCVVFARESKKAWILFLLTGICSGVTLLFKQNFAVAIFLSNFIFFVFVKEFHKKNVVVWHLFGFFSVVLLQLFYFLQTQTLGWYLSEMKFLLIEQVLLKGVLNSAYPWQYPGPIFYQIVKFLLYISPLLISLGSLIYFWLKKDTLKNFQPAVLYFPIVSILYFLLSFRPTTDYVHLVPLIALSSINIVLTIAYLPHSAIKNFILSATFVLLFLGGYTALYKNYYRWDPSLLQQSTWSSDPHLQLYTSLSSQREIRELQIYFQQHAANEKYLFVYNYAPLWYVVLDKHNPTRYDYLHPGVLNPAMENETIQQLQTFAVQHIITNMGLENDPSQIAQYIFQYYHPVKTLGDTKVWEKNE